MVESQISIEIVGVNNENNSVKSATKKVKMEQKDELNNGHMTSNSLSESINKLSKRQLKRLKKKELWLANLSAKRAKEKLKLKQKKQEARDKNIKLGPSRKELKNCKMSTSKCKIKVALDFSFDDLMSPKDIAKCISQVLRCYSLNRRSPNPMQFYVVNFNGLAKKEMEKHNGYEKWDVNFHSENYMTLFKKESIVYLTSDSHNVIQTLEDDKVYIIGALVDHNSQKGLCYRTAIEKGISHAQLPLGEYLEMKTRKVLAINHVFDIMLNVCNGLSWKEAFLKVLPQRKGAIERSKFQEVNKEDKEKLNVVVHTNTDVDSVNQS